MTVDGVCSEWEASQRLHRVRNHDWYRKTPAEYTIQVTNLCRGSTLKTTITSAYVWDKVLLPPTRSAVLRAPLIDTLTPNRRYLFMPNLNFHINTR